MASKEPRRTDDRLRVAVVTETYPPEIGGAAMCTGHFVKALVDAGHFVDLVRPRQASERGTKTQGSASTQLHQLLVAGLPVPFHGGLQFGLPAPRQLLARWKRDRPDLVHIVTEGPLGWSALSAALELGIAVTSGFHTNFHAYTAHYGLGWMRRVILAGLRRFHNGTSTTLVPTAQTRDELAELGFGNLAVVRRGVDTCLFSPSRRRPDLRLRWGCARGELVMAVVGRLAPEKNVDLAVRTYEQLRRSKPGARLVLVGEGPERRRLERRAQGLIFAGMLRGEALAEHYASADVFLFPSLTETFGNVALEAMASGLGVVAFDDAGPRELIRSGQNGVLVARGDEAAFQRGVRDLATDTELLARVRRQAAADARSLGWEGVGREFVRTLAAAIDRPAEQPLLPCPPRESRDESRALVTSRAAG